jgi:apolipoprotein N-acyltransferase
MNLPLILRPLFPVAKQLRHFSLLFARDPLAWNRMGQFLFPPIASGILLGLTTIGNGPFEHAHWATFFGFVPLWSYWLKEKSAKKIFLSGWLCQFVFTLIAFHWLAYTVNEFSHMGLALSTLVLLLYCSLANLQFPLAGLAWHWIFRARQPSLPVQIAALALLTALFQRMGTMVFAWNFGYAWLYMGWPGLHLADIGGFRWLCSISICLNGFLLLAWVKRKEGGWKAASAAALAFALINGAGWLHARSLPAPDSTLRVLLIQPNIGNRDKEKLEQGENGFREAILQRYFTQTENALRSLSVPPDFAVWPENAFPSVIGERDLVVGLGPALKSFLVKNRLNLLTGSFGLDDAGEKVTNALVSLSSSGRWASPPYHKMILLPFGEYVPFSHRFPWLRNIFPDVRDYGHGLAPTLIQSGPVSIGPQICYEGLFDFISRDLAGLGAQVIVNITNDSWYGDWMEPWQHFYITMAKAVETRRPLIRATNTGLSSVALANGTILEISPISREWWQLYELPYLKNPPSTAFMRWGYWLDWFFLLVALLAVLASDHASRMRDQFLERRQRRMCRK